MKDECFDEAELGQTRGDFIPCRFACIVFIGLLGLLFDCVVQHHNCDVGVAGKTTALAVRFRRPTPLLTELDFEVTRSLDGDRITSTVQLTHDGTLLAEAEIRAVAGDRANLPEVSARRPAP